MLYRRLSVTRVAKRFYWTESYIGSACMTVVGDPDPQRQGGEQMRSRLRCRRYANTLHLWWIGNWKVIALSFEYPSNTSLKIPDWWTAPLSRRLSALPFLYKAVEGRGLSCVRVAYLPATTSFFCTSLNCLGLSHHLEIPYLEERSCVLWTHYLKVARTIKDFERDQPGTNYVRWTETSAARTITILVRSF